VIASEGGYDKAADIWSLGITALELAEMWPPYWDIEPVMRALFKVTRHLALALQPQPYPQPQP